MEVGIFNVRENNFNVGYAGVHATLCFKEPVTFKKMLKRKKKEKKKKRQNALY